MRTSILAAVVAFAALPAGCAHRPWDQPSMAWKRVISEHFLVHTDADSDEYTPVVERLELVHAALSTTFFDDMQVRRSEVLLFGRTRDFEGVTADSEVVGFFVPRMGRDGRGLLVFSSQGDPAAVASVAAHELAHQFLHARGQFIPAWLHEGFAQYAGGIQIYENVVAFDMGGIPPGLVYLTEPVPLESLFAVATQADQHAVDRAAFYLTAWMLVRDLLSNPGGARAIASGTVRFRTLIDRLVQDPSPRGQAGAVSEAFGGVPLARIEAALRAEHAAINRGIGQARMRATRGKTLNPPASRRLEVEEADRSEVREMCQALRAAR